MYLEMWFLFNSFAGSRQKCAKQLDEENSSVFAFFITLFPRKLLQIQNGKKKNHITNKKNIP